MYRAYWRRLVWPAEILLQETIHVVLNQLCCSLRTSSFLFLYILADLISFLEIQRLQLAGSSSTVFAVNLILTFLNFSSSGLIRGGGGEGGKAGEGGSIPGLEQRSWSGKESFSVDERATATKTSKPQLAGFKPRRTGYESMYFWYKSGSA